MSFHHSAFSRVTSLCLAVTLLLQSGLVRAADSPASARIQDVELGAGGVLKTRVVDVQGNPVSGEQIRIEYKGQEIAASVSDSDGFVAITGLRPGLHSIVTPMGAATACRFWNEGSAPPSAVAVPAVVSDMEVVRGQFGAFNLPQIIYGGIAIAALIVAIDANQDAEDNEDRIKALENASP